MRFVALCVLGLIGLAAAGDVDPAAPSAAPGKKGKKAGKKGAKAKAKQPQENATLSDRQLIMPGTPTYTQLSVSASVAGRQVLPPASTCPFNNCAACTKKPGCAWIRGSCLPCINCPPYWNQCGGCTSNSQCGNGARCDNGQCLANDGDPNCDYLYDCMSCLARPNCLWDPNTLTGSCKPKEQCDFKYQQRELVIGPVTAAPPATACVATTDRCSQRDFNGVVLDPNTQRGVGCTNHGQCARGEYCYSCSKCRGSCTRCRSFPGPVSGLCAPAYRCPIDNDSISQTCPAVTPIPPVVFPPVTIPPVVLPPVVMPSCNYALCSTCTAAPGCVWSGTVCYYTTAPCSNVGCANTPAQCPRVATPTIPASANCAYNNCQSCTAANGCVWSGTVCYYTTIPCTAPGCANVPAQCGGCTTNAQCGPGRRCSSGACVDSAGDRNCDYYSSCSGCLSNPNCLWDPNELVTKCKPKEQCDFTYRGLALPGASPTPAPATACVKTVDKCSQTDFNGAVLDPNQSRGAGCTNHGQCRAGIEYCFSCSKCRGDCSICNQGGLPMSGACGPISRCYIDRDSIDDTCPRS